MNTIAKALFHTLQVRYMLIMFPCLKTGSGVANQRNLMCAPGRIAQGGVTSLNHNYRLSFHLLAF